jgi:hypothetical protein
MERVAEWANKGGEALKADVSQFFEKQFRRKRLFQFRGLAIHSQR